MNAGLANVTAAAIIVALAASAVAACALARACERGYRTRQALRRADRAENQLGIYERWLGQPERLHAAHPDIPRFDEDELR